MRRLIANIMLRMWWLLVPTQWHPKLGPYVKDQRHTEIMKDAHDIVRPDLNWHLK